MFRIVALLAALTLIPMLSLAQEKTPTVKCKNERWTHGIFGQTRKDDKFMPNDLVCLTFDVEGVKVKNSGEIRYSIAIEVLKKDKNGKATPVDKRPAVEYPANNNLGKGTFSSVALWPVSKMAQPGQYSLKVTVEDILTEKSDTLEKSFEVVEPKFAFAQTCFTAANGAPMPPIAIAGQQLELRWLLVGAEEEKKEKKYKVNVTARIQENSKDVVEKPFSGDVESDDLSNPGVVLFNPYPIHLNRPGKFKVLLTAKCGVSGKETSETLDLLVLDPKSVAEK